MSTLHLSWLMLRRDWHAGEWRVLLIALLLAVGSIATVGLFTDRVRLVLQQDATSLMGADLRVTAIHPLPSSYRDAAQQRGLQVLNMAVFLSMVSRQERNTLAEIQAVEAGYPLRGKIQIDDGILRVAQSVPERGTLWADKRLLQLMGLQLGDEVTLGALRLRMVAQVARDVDQSVGFASFAPRVTVNIEDLAASQLVQEGSRIRYRLLVAGEPAQVADFRSWIQDQLMPGEKLEGVRDVRPEIRTALERAEHFFGLAALTAVILAAVALALAARHFIARHLDTCAMMRCLGATQAQVLRIFGYQFLMLGVLSVLLGGLLGYVAQAGLVQSIASMRDAGLPAPGWRPLWQAASSGMALLLGFTFLPLIQLKSISPLRVIRREIGLPRAHTGMVFMLGGGVLCGLFLWQAGSLKLGLIVLAGLVMGMLFFGFLARLAIAVLAKLPFMGSHAFANLARHGRANALQIVALGLGGMALLLLTFVRADLMASWLERLPPDAPNRFMVGIQYDQRDALNKFFDQWQLPVPAMFPLVRGRLIAINQLPIGSDDYADSRARRLVEREFNLSWSENLPLGNTLVQGKWWENGTTPAFSVEEGLAKTLDIHLGDTLTYDVAGNQFIAPVVNLRKVQWDSMQANFFVIATPGMLEDFPTNYLSSFYLPPDKSQVGNTLIRQFPNLRLIDVDAMIEQIRHIMNQIAQTLSAVFLFTLLSGLAVLYAALLATQDERIHQAAILSMLGADSHYVRRLHLTEFAVLGALSGLFAAAGSVFIGWMLAHYVLEIPYHAGTMVWVIGVGGGVIIVLSAGWLATRRLFKLSPMQVLQSV